MIISISRGYFNINYEPKSINTIKGLNNYSFDKFSKAHEYIKQFFCLYTSAEKFIIQNYLLSFIEDQFKLACGLMLTIILIFVHNLSS